MECLFLSNNLTPNLGEAGSIVWGLVCLETGIFPKSAGDSSGAQSQFCNGKEEEVFAALDELSMVHHQLSG